MTAIIIFCTLLLVAYLFELTSSKTKIPAVILLLLLGWGLRQTTVSLGMYVPDLSPVLPILGTTGLILIVLEGSLELELNRSKLKLVGKSFMVALLPVFATAFLLAYFFSLYEKAPFINCLANAIPLCVISSSIAIPSVRNLVAPQREFVVYESSLSDIIGVLFFNFVTLSAVGSGYSFTTFSLHLLIIFIVSFAATVILSLLLSRIEHHIKFVPIILLVILIYVVSKIYHLPALIFIMLFGLFIGNLDELKRFKWIRKLKPDILDKEVHKFKEITTEGVFIIRALFFILFGYLIETSEITNSQTILWSVLIVAVIMGCRALLLKLFKIPLKPLLFVSPRGLITILLFLSIEPSQQILLVNKSLIIQIIVLTTLLMMVGLMSNKADKSNSEPNLPTEAPLTDNENIS